MKSIYITCTLVLFFSNLMAQKTKPSHKKIEQEVSTWLEETKVPGIAIAQIENGKVVQTVLKGEDAQGNEITFSTIFDVASLTKTITTLAVLKLAEQKQMDLDEPLYKFWIDPDIQNDIRHQKLTPRTILSHRSGFKNWRYMYEDEKLSFDFEPGEKFKYSGEGFEYLRRALEHKFETSFEELVDTLVFKPIGMENSTLVWNKKMENLDFAGSHNNEGQAYDYEKSYKANAADNLLTNLSDFIKLTKSLLNESYLNGSLFEEMGRPHSKVREGIDFGLGWIVFQDLPNDEYALFNAGSDQGVNSLVVILPKSNRGLIVMTNGDNGRGLAMKAISVFLEDSGNQILERF
ncbi:serine hydrolase domain-containing protein [Muricauda brasiliensis]|uniref:serine hydrolase domain-containing protein n=1 Tax=Muricauda brasiliensis TaxID=2162892 RepID=UPI000D34D799|nr:serine hydrolase domain-containing protein [Muricauda brasiliensis]